MKKPLLISTTLVVLALSATSIYAQVSGGSSLITKMKAAAANFTLASELNPGQTGLQSAPVSGKKTGDILTAGEWNRVLELLGEGGGSGSSGSGWVDVPLTDTADYDTTCLYEVNIKTTTALHNNLMNGDTSWRTGTARTNKYLGLAFTDGSATTYASWGVPSSSKSTYGYRDSAGTFVPSSGVSILGMRRLCGGGGSSGSGWENVPLTDTNPFNQQCMYRVVMQGQTYYLETIHENRAYWINTMYFDKTNKSALVGGIAPFNTATKMEKFCGGSVGGSGLSLYKCTNAQSMDSTNAPCYGASRNGGAGTNQYRVISCTDNDGTRSYTMSSILNFGQLVANKWAVSVNGGTIECDDGTVLVMDTQSSGGSLETSCYEKNDISLANAYTAGGIALDHNLGSRPVHIEWFVENIVADGGYQPGDRVYAMDFQATSGGEYRSIAFWNNQQQVGMTWDNAGATYKIQFQTKRALGGLRTTPTQFTADSPKWSLGVRACK